MYVVFQSGKFQSTPSAHVYLYIGRDPPAIVQMYCLYYPRFKAPLPL